MSYSFEDDPFVCPECKKAGYCIKRAKRKESQINEMAALTNEELSHLVPVRTAFKEAKTKFGRKLQQAHDLFHQEEYEQASYMYLDMMESRNDCEEVTIGLAASLFFLNRFDEAATIVMNLSDLLHKNFPSRFLSLCEQKIKEQKAMEGNFNMFNEKNINTTATVHSK